MSRERRRPHITIEQESNSLRRTYPHDVQMYRVPPSGECSLFEFKESCTERLVVLQLVEQIALRNKPKTAAECRIKLIEKLYQRDLNSFANLINNQGNCETEEILCARRRDHISHFMLKLAFCFKHKKWFVKQEVRLFRWRLSSLENDALEQLIRNSGLKCTLVPRSRVQRLKKLLLDSTPQIDVDSESFYRVPCSLVTNLISMRKVFLKGGMAYVPLTLMPFVLVVYFRKSLVTGFEYARETVCNINDDDRLTEFFKDICKCVGKQQLVLQTVGKVKIDSLDKLSKISYPLCMRRLHEAVKTNHHLRDGGRVQYSLFLKGIGVSWQDALQFWENEFLGIMDEEEFRKEHAYHFRHLFGMEGRKADYQPFSCLRIMQSDLGLNDYHGCPFKHLSKADLETKLESYGLRKNAVEEITKLAEDRQYTSACKKYFEVTHCCVVERDLFHPNDYFNESRKKADFLRLESSSEEDDFD